jgi:DNA repair exonuclease SbcCD nuclease subunit
MNSLFTADFHLTSLPDDSYRWTVFPWLRAYAANEPLDALWILGDLTDRKDEHPAELVCRLCDELARLAVLCPVYILAGNHDYVERSEAFFRFLDRQEGIRFFHEPATVRLHGLSFKVLPHTAKWKRQYRNANFFKYDRVLFHQAIQGAAGDNGHPLHHGMPRDVFGTVKESAFCLGGDVHTPQKIGMATYVGAPHPIKFGDDYTPSAMLERNGKLRRVTRSTVKKVVLHIEDVEALATCGLDEGDFAKVTVTLPRREIVKTDRHRARLLEIGRELGIHLRRVAIQAKDSPAAIEDGESPVSELSTPLQTLRRFVAARGIDESMAAAGAALLAD